MQNGNWRVPQLKSKLSTVIRKLAKTEGRLCSSHFELLPVDMNCKMSISFTKFHQLRSTLFLNCKLEKKFYLNFFPLLAALILFRVIVMIDVRSAYFLLTLDTV